MVGRHARADTLLARSVAIAALACVGCVGDIDAGATGPGGSRPRPPIDTREMGSTPLHRLNRVELAATLSDLFGSDVVALVPAGSDPEVQGFDTHADALRMSESSIDSAMRLAEAVAAAIPEDVLAPCALETTERDCAATRIAALAPRILRRALEDGELAELLLLWDDVVAREGAEIATRAVWQRLLMSPDFLYHVEVGDPDGRLTDAELANRISYLVWESMPDDALIEARDGGQLRTPDGVRVELERMLGEPRGIATMERFFAQWANLDHLDTLVKDSAIYPEFEALRAPMRQEFQLFVRDLVTRDGTVEELFTSRTSFADETLAAYYGVPHEGRGFTPITLPDTRAGVLTQGAFLSIHGKGNRSSPILRGVFVLERVLCEPLAPPDPDAVAAGERAPSTTTRQLVESLTSPPTCAACHSQINPIGFTFESFDGAGHFRTEENGMTVDTSGAVTMGDAAGDVADAVELVEALGRSRDVRECLATQWFRSRFRRTETAGDTRVISALAAALEESGDRIRALATALADQESLYLLHYSETR